MFEFQSPRSFLCGAGASAKIGELVHSLGCRSVMIVTDPGVLKAGLLAAACKGLDQEGVCWSVFSDVQADPPDTVIEAAAAAALKASADCIVGLGGGSSLDVAKLVALLAKGEETLAEVYGVGKVRGKRLPLILAPTTAGTGSEVTPISIVTTGGDEKKGVVAGALLPDWAVLDPELTLGLPAHVTAATGIDAMVHAIEAYTSSRLKNPLSDCLAREALALLAGNIHQACGNGGDMKARENMLLGAMLAGMAFANSPVAAVHALAYPIGARFHVPHGLSNSLVLPAVLRFNRQAAQEQYAEIADIVLPGISGTADARSQALIEHLSALPRLLGLPTRLSEVNIVAADLPMLAADAMKQTRLLVNNPRQLSEADALAIYQESL